MLVITSTDGTGGWDSKGNATGSTWRGVSRDERTSAENTGEEERVRGELGLVSSLPSLGTWRQSLGKVCKPLEVTVPGNSGERQGKMLERKGGSVEASQD